MKKEPYCHLHAKLHQPILAPNCKEKEKVIDIHAHDAECCVCYENIDIIRTSCGHMICRDCAILLTDTKCPLCRTNIANSLDERIMNIRKHIDVLTREKMEYSRKIRDLSDRVNLLTIAYLINGYPIVH